MATFTTATSPWRGGDSLQSLIPPSTHRRSRRAGLIVHLMGRGAPLTDIERGRIQGLHEAGLGLRQIARQVEHSVGAVNRVLFVTPTEHKTPGPAASLSERETRYLVPTAAKGQLSTKQLKEEIKLSTSVRTIQRVLAGVDWLVYTKMDNTLPLSAEDKRAREAWAWEMLMNKDPVMSLDTFIFSDEKKWNLDGADGFQTYWRDLRRPSRQTKRRQAGGGSVMVWDGFSAAGKTELAVLHGKQNSDDYVYTLSAFMLPCGTDFMFQQNGASIHRSKRTQEFLVEQEVRVLPWPARSPDLNPIENLWSIMNRHVDANGRQFSSVSELTVALYEAWYAIDMSVLQSLIESMPRRCKECIKKHGVTGLHERVPCHSSTGVIDTSYVLHTWVHGVGVPAATQ
ncbi:unnamed protein product [Phytophthora fragariaefolia]|uniref:Unnamed protein product n=1 Tax=Phytophthora fragariaefolia TaxID=1490495 RepID=A0A9W6Y812_9STRA|nr:unnamed protein product [Phytophthora fragariaefolia]